MPDPVRVALVGLGYWGPGLARNLNGLTGARLTALCDLDAARLAPLRSQYPGARLTTDYQSILADPDIDAVVLATPAKSHGALGQMALQHGKHLLVEKPLAMSVDEAEMLVALADAQQRVLMVGHVFEYNPAVRYIKSLVTSGELGDIYYMYSTRVNLGRVQTDINALWSIAPHDISIMMYLLDRSPVSVTAQGAMVLSGKVEDVVFLGLNFPGNVVGHAHVSWLDPSKVRSMTVVGSRKMVVYDDVASEGKVKVYDKGAYLKSEGPQYGEFQYKLHSGDILIPKLDLAEPLRIECEHFVNCVQNGETPLTDGREGLRVVRVLEAAQKSLATGGSVVSIGD
jgi:predicted dehydrogenase